MVINALYLHYIIINNMQTLINTIQNQNPGMLSRMPITETDYWEFQAQIIQDCLITDNDLILIHANLSVFPPELIEGPSPLDCHCLCFKLQGNNTNNYTQSVLDNMLRTLENNLLHEGLESIHGFFDGDYIILTLTMTI